MFKALRFAWYFMFGKHDDDSTERILVRELILELREDRTEIRKLLEITRRLVELLERVPHASSVRLRFILNPQGEHMADPISISVGQTVAAKVEVLDQNGAVMAYDFNANPPSFAIDNAAVTIAVGSGPDVESVTGVSAGTAVLSVNVPGVANPTDSATITVTAVETVPTSVRLSFS